MLERVARRGGPAVHVELAVDRAKVGVNGAETDHEAIRHLRVGEALGHQREHLDLAGGQAIGGIGGGILARRGDQLDRRTEGNPRTFLPGRTEAGLSQRAARLGEHAVVTLAEPNPERHLECRPDRVGRSEELDGTLGVSSLRRQKCRRHEHDPAEPAVAELDEERQRLFELRRRRLGVTEVGIDVCGAPECLPVGATVADRAQDVEALVGVRPRSDESTRWPRCGQTVQPERDSVRVTEPPKDPEAPLEELPGTVHAPGDHEAHRKSIEGTCHPSLVSQVLVDGQRLAKELLGGRVVSARPQNQREARVRLRHAFGIV
jgi:hypothetical protein